VNQRLVTVASFNSPVEADIVRGQLREAGIEAFLADEALAGNFWALVNAVGGVKVQVADADLAPARELLQRQREPPPADASAALSSGSWRCPECGSQVDAGFEICWNCGTSRDGQIDPSFAAEPAESEPQSAPSPAALDWQSPPDGKTDLDSNPFRSPQAPLHDERVDPIVPEEETDYGDELAQRAMRSAVLGLIFCPVVFNIVSVSLLVQLAVHNYPLGPRGQRRFYLAWLLNILIAPLILILNGPMSRLFNWLR
jgi:hypothetical protein